MPNWCMNELTVFGNKDDVETLINNMKYFDTEFSLEKIAPEPDVVEDWHQWRLENWGTKWDVEAQITESGFIVGTTSKYAKFVFDSAWNPPTAAIEELARKFPALSFHLAYDEPGMDFSGVIYWSDGKRIDEYEFSHSVSTIKNLSDFQTYYQNNV